MTHDPRAREVADNLALAVGNACCYLTTEPDVYLELRKATGDAIDVLRGRAGLRVVPAKPSEADVERVAKASWDEREKLAKGYLLNGNVWWDDADVPQNMRDTYRLVARAAIAAFLQGGEHAPKEAGDDK